jgi:hypothetical protein
MSNVLSPKAAAEEILVTLDYSESLSAGEVLTGVVSLTALINSGEDEAPGDILDGEPQIGAGGKVLTVAVKGGVPNCSYRITGVCDTSIDAKRLSLTAVLPVGSLP